MKNTEKLPDTPNLNIMAEKKEAMDTCRDFLDFLMCRYTLFDKKAARERAYENVSVQSDHINADSLLAGFFGIDEKEAEKERQALLSFIQEG